MTYIILKTEIFERKFSKLSSEIQKEVSEIIEKLSDNPFTGKPLFYPFFREKKIKKFRIYYLTYKEYLVVYLITISEKKDQQQAINTVRLFLDKYREDIEAWMKENRA